MNNPNSLVENINNLKRLGYTRKQAVMATLFASRLKKLKEATQNATT